MIPDDTVTSTSLTITPTGLRPGDLFKQYGGSARFVKFERPGSVVVTYHTQRHHNIPLGHHYVLPVDWCHLADVTITEDPLP